MNETPGRGPNRVIRGTGRPLPEPVEMGRGRTAVRLELVAQGGDLLLLVTGGEAHVGAVAVCSPSVGDGDPEPVVTVVPGHKEGPLAGDCARRLARAAACTCCVAAGIHQDAAAPEEIAAIVENVKRGMDEVIRGLAGES